MAQPQVIPAPPDQPARRKLAFGLIALPALSGAASTLLFGKLSDIFGRRAITMLISLLVIRTIPEVSMDGRDT